MKIREISLDEIRDVLQTDYIGANLKINSLCYADLETQTKAAISFCSNMNYIRRSMNIKSIKALFCTAEIYSNLSPEQRNRACFFLVEDPASVFYFLHNHLYENTVFYNEWDFSPKIGKNCCIHSTALIDDGVVMGNNVTIGPCTSVLRGSKIGNNVKIDSHTVIGCEGNATKHYVKGRLTHIHHAGGVEIGDDSFIGSQTAISRNVLYGRLSIGSSCQIDNCVHIGHNSRVDDRCVISAGTIICGNVSIGSDCYFAPGTIIRDKLRLGHGVTSHLGSVVVEDIDNNSTIAGFYAIPHLSWLMKTKDDRERYLQR
jgi:UDP-3-O-[3-hydroxymyristoyl] glucosamine N-acyltransferase